MKPIIKFIEQNGQDLESFNPEIIDNFWCYLTIRIGWDEIEGSDDFGFQLCTPRALDHSSQHKGHIWGRHHLIVNHFDAAQIRSMIEEKIAECARPTVEETTLILSRFFHWEFEDYQE